MTDSHSGILNEEAERLGIKVLPMPFYIGEKVYREGVDLSRDEFYDMLRKGVDVSTSQPSPVEVLDMWKEMLKEYEEIVYIPLSSALSGSCMAAQAMANEDAFAGKVFVVDNGRVATPMHRSVLDAVEMAEKGYSAAEIKKILEETREKMTIYIGLSTLEYLKKRWKSQLHDSPGSRCPEHQTSHALQHRNPRYLPEMPRYEEVPQSHDRCDET